MASCLILEHDFEIPMDVRTLDDFRRWALSDAFPESGRIDFINGTIEIDMSPENAFTHSTPKIEIVRMVGNLLKVANLGYLFSDRMRCSSVPADLSAEPDVVFISHDALDSGSVRLVRQKGGGKDDYIEIEGGPDLVVEIVSKSSVEKDTKRLPKAYFKAGVREFWLIDARRDELSSVIHFRGKGRFVAQERDEQAFQRSRVLKRRLRLDRQEDGHGHWQYDLRIKR
jgi:Uma2 family endonuclease